MSNPVPPKIARRIVLTGASGQLGCLAGRAFDKMPGVVWVGLDKTEGINVHRVDLTEPIERWQHHLEGADVIVHLAGASALHTNESVARRMIDDVSHNVLAAADVMDVKRIVYASSCEVLAGLVGTNGPLSGETPACPLNPYAAAKARVETIGQTWAQHAGRSFVALRIGMYLPQGRPGPRNQLSLWKQRLWLDGLDWQQAIRLASTTEIAGYCAIAIVSNNQGMRWKLAPAERILGYVPQAHYHPKQPAMRTASGVLSGLRDRLHRLEKMKTPAHGTK